MKDFEAAATAMRERQGLSRRERTLASLGSTKCVIVGCKNRALRTYCVACGIAIAKKRKSAQQARWWLANRDKRMAKKRLWEFRLVCAEVLGKAPTDVTDDEMQFVAQRLGRK